MAGSFRGVRSVRFGQGENKPGSMASNAERQLRVSMLMARRRPSISPGMYKALLFSSGFGMLWPTPLR